MQGMIMHHAQAVEMTALIASHTKDKEIRSLGARISLSQTDEIKFMKRWLVARDAPLSMAMHDGDNKNQPTHAMPDMDSGDPSMPAMPGMLTLAQMAALREADGAEFDRRFLTGMMQHHRGALVMVEQLFDTPGAGQDADLFDFATDADNTQRAEIRIMEDMLKEKRMKRRQSLAFRLAGAVFTVVLIGYGVGALHAQAPTGQAPTAPAAPAAKAPEPEEEEPFARATGYAAAPRDDRFDYQRSARRTKAWTL